MEEVKRGCGWGEIVACHAGYYKFSHKHIKPTHTGNLLIDAHNMTHLSGFPNFSKFRLRRPLCFYRPTHPTETALGVLFIYSHETPLDPVSRVLSEKSAGSFPQQRLVIEPNP